jgi:hypothetical protein
MARALHRANGNGCLIPSASHGWRGNTVPNILRPLLPLAAMAFAIVASSATPVALARGTSAPSIPTALIPARLAALQQAHAGASVLHARSAPSPYGAAPWLEQQVFASDGAQEDTFGSAVAIDGDTALISAPQPGSETGGIPAGHGVVYVFRRQGGEWVQTAELAADDGADGDFFGFAVALQGNTALVGAHFVTVAGHAHQGAAYVFRYANGAWTQAQKLVADDGAEQSMFGAAVALDGDHAFVGAYGATINGNFGQGAVYAYSGVNDTSLVQTAELTADDGVANDQFGYSVAAHGGTVMTGAPNAKIGDNAGQGAVYLFSDASGTWTRTQKIVADDGIVNDAFGIAIAYDDAHALITAPLGNGFIGEWYAFGLDSGNRSQSQKILPPAGATDIFYALSIGLSGDRAVVTYPGYDAGHGRVDLYGLDDIDGWRLLQPYTHDTGNPNDFFPYYGWSAGISGTTFLVGAYGQQVGDNLYQGAAYFYVRDAIFADGFDGG